MQTSEERYADWKKVIEEQKTSGLSQAAFCKAKGLNHYQLEVGRLLSWLEAAVILKKYFLHSWNDAHRHGYLDKH